MIVGLTVGRFDFKLARDYRLDLGWVVVCWIAIFSPIVMITKKTNMLMKYDCEMCGKYDKKRGLSRRIADSHKDSYMGWVCFDCGVSYDL